MTQRLDFDDYGDGIGNAWTVLRDNANRCGPDAAVPTCPGWTVRDLLAHQGMVHRWATGILRGEDVDTVAVERMGRDARDQLAWFDDGARALLQALVDAPDDLDAFFFLPGAGPAKGAWARRQCHETTIHAVDAMAAALGRAPRAAETWLRPRLAVDGLDELLTGFLPRPKHHVVAANQRTVVVRAEDADAAWTIRVSPDPVLVTRGAPDVDADTVLSGTAVGLYLALWNRGDEVRQSGEDFLGGWREQMRVTWG